MNIFYLDNDPVACAQAHVDKHVIKMVLEYAQLLSSAHHLNKSKWRSQVYKLTHEHHPSAKWTRYSRANYDWLYQLFKATNDEYAHRYGKWHGSFISLSIVLANNPCTSDVPFVEPYPAMDEHYKVADDSIASYRNYYRLAKRHLHSWTKRSPPIWITENVEET